MTPRRCAALVTLFAAVLAGCSALGVGMTPAPTFWWVENPTTISYVAGPATAPAQRPVTLWARVVVGSSSCDRFKSLQAAVDPSTRQVVLSATRETKHSDQDLACTSDLGALLASVSVTFPATGSYQVSVERYQPTAFTPDEVPRATIDVSVEGP